MGFQIEGRMQVQMGPYIYDTEKYYVNAQTTIPYYMCSSDDCLKVVVACLRPTALYHLFKINVSKIINTGANPKHLFQDRLSQSRQHLLIQNTTEDNIQLLNSIFMEQFNKAKPHFNFIDATIDFIIKNRGEIKIDELVLKLNVSKRYFQKKFKEMIGIQPSLYIKIIRYNFIFSSLTDESLYYKSTSASLYFYDSAHYSKDFKDYFGLPPSKFDPEQHVFLKLTAIEKAVWVNAFQSLSAK
ncbi:helix-turn-helix domain-containing protein [Flavobacterium sp. CS20]|uniref:helix-turn-helix domain-containing protein n=1 Tax=Flavobacterium sp. CS20 TaxID=2775246 RepID=UPI001B39EDFA|nr:helix-turn-helix domain-containing protein [Flavobacterium sp. CS20]QTY28210.1 helix-turn-helix domain-containing protein [Flavobacterium sp. CS20]